MWTVDKEIEYHALSITLLERDSPQESQSVFKVFCILHSIALKKFLFLSTMTFVVNNPF